ncbi:hypothetical protein [Methanoculleus sp.]|uniref:hypothetical protein n=1 Tax=Methanoculleus sp. TaxID=90427 RepID=UPI0025E63BA0|nr:hypothetical protein [Methanoculleus sp.]
MHAETRYFNGARSLQRRISFFIAGGLILASLLAPRVFIEVFPPGNDIVAFRIIYALFVAFDLLIPVLLTIVFFRKAGSVPGFVIPFAVYGVLCPVIDASWLSFQGHLITNLIPVSTLFGGVGLGIIGLGSSQLAKEKVTAIAAIFLGLIVLMASIPNFFTIVHWLMTGDPDSLLALL